MKTKTWKALVSDVFLLSLAGWLIWEYGDEIIYIFNDFKLLFNAFLDILGGR